MYSRMYILQSSGERVERVSYYKCVGGWGWVCAVQREGVGLGWVVGFEQALCFKH